MNQNSFLNLIDQSIRTHWELPAMTDFQGKTYKYKDFAWEIDRLHDFFKEAGVERQDLPLREELCKLGDCLLPLPSPTERWP